MSTKSPWGNIGAWAAEAERAEAEEREAAEREEAQRAAAKAANKSQDSYPSVKESVTAAGKQKKKTKMTLQEFTMASTYGSASAPYATRLTPEEMMRLPTGPKERSADEMQYGRLGGGFANYGSRSGGPPSGRSRNYSSTEGGYGGGGRGYGGFVDDDRRRGPPMSRDSEFDQMPSRADEVDNWASLKRSQPAFDSPMNSGPARPNRYAALGGGSGGFSKADEVDNWASVKKPLPPPPSGPVTGRSSSFGSGFRSEMRPGPEPERWTRDFSGNNQETLVEEQPLPPAVKVNKPNPFGAARPREEVLAEKGLDWKKLDLEIEVKKAATTSRPTSSQSSRPGSSQSGRSEGALLQQQQQQQGTVEVPAVKPKPKVNPFGDAKPREVLLEEKGLDWRKIDLELEHKSIARPETEEEKNLKEEIEHLKKESVTISGDEQVNLHAVILQKEKDLESLIQELDDKIRFSQKPIDRPGSGAGRYTGSDRPGSGAGRYTGSDRPGSGAGRYTGPDRPGSGSGRYTGPDRPGSGAGRQAGLERPGSGAGRYAGAPVRPPSHAGSYEEPRAAEFMERPRSRGIGEAWPRPVDDRRSFSGGRDRGFLGSRDFERSGSRDRW